MSLTDNHQSEWNHCCCYTSEQNKILRWSSRPFKMDYEIGKLLRVWELLIKVCRLIWNVLTSSKGKIDENSISLISVAFMCKGLVKNIQSHNIKWELSVWKLFAWTFQKLINNKIWVLKTLANVKLRSKKHPSKVWSTIYNFCWTVPSTKSAFLHTVQPAAYWGQPKLLVNLVWFSINYSGSAGN